MSDHLSPIQAMICAVILGVSFTAAVAYAIIDCTEDKASAEILRTCPQPINPTNGEYYAR